MKPSSSIAAVWYFFKPLDASSGRQAAGIAAKERGVYSGRQAGTTKAKPARAAKLRERGMTDNEIATALGVSRRTIQRYLNA